MPGVGVTEGNEHANTMAREQYQAGNCVTRRSVILVDKFIKTDQTSCLNL